MAQSTSRIAIFSGVCTSIGLAPHLVFLLVLFLRGMPSPLGFLIPTYFAAVIFGEYLFYKRMIQNIPFIEWIKRALHPKRPGYFLWAYVAEIAFDVIFLSLAIKFQWNPLHFFLILLGCKFLATPLQTYLSNLFLSKNASFALAVPVQIPLLFICDHNPEFFLYALVLKGLLCNGIAVSRSQYTAEISSQDAEA
ncbi:MAG: hypothetical protein ACRDF4_12345 [Rhabdochlamydiaceae bacterium]